MTGTRLTITVDDADAQGVLDRVVAFAAAPPRDMFAEFGEHLLNSTRDRAKLQVSPDGVSWAELSEDYKAYKDKKRPGVTKLKFDMHMLGDQLSYQIGDGFVEIGTNAVYGAIHQWGGTAGMAPGPAAIPARPWLGASADDTTALAEILGEYLQEAIDAG